MTTFVQKFTNRHAEARLHIPFAQPVAARSLRLRPVLWGGMAQSPAAVRCLRCRPAAADSAQSAPAQSPHRADGGHGAVGVGTADADALPQPAGGTLHPRRVVRRKPRRGCRDDVQRAVSPHVGIVVHGLRSGCRGRGAGAVAGDGGVEARAEQRVAADCGHDVRLHRRRTGEPDTELLQPRCAQTVYRVDAWLAKQRDVAADTDTRRRDGRRLADLPLSDEAAQRAGIGRGIRPRAGHTRGARAAVDSGGDGAAGGRHHRLLRTDSLHRRGGAAYSARHLQNLQPQAHSACHGADRRQHPAPLRPDLLGLHLPAPHLDRQRTLRRTDYHIHHTETKNTNNLTIGQFYNLTI